MTYERVEAEVLELQRRRDGKGAQLACRRFFASGPSARDAGRIINLEAQIMARNGGDYRRVWVLTSDAAELLKPYKTDYAKVCAGAVATAAQFADLPGAKKWMMEFEKTNRQKELPELRPVILACYAKALWGMCRFTSALAVLSRAYSLMIGLSGAQRNEVAERQTALMAAWCCAQNGNAELAGRWLARANGPAISECWADLRRATVAEICISRGLYTEASEVLSSANKGADDIGAMYVLHARVHLAKTVGADWQTTAQNALLKAVVTRQCWALQPLRHLINVVDGKETIRVATA